MAVNAYLILEGIEGSSTSKPKAIDVLSFSFGVSNSVSMDQGSGQMTAGKASVSSVSIMKVLDKTSPLLFHHCSTGTSLTKATLLYDKPLGNKQQDYFKIELETVFVESVQFSGSSENPTESLSLAFKKVKVCYNPESGDGKSMKGFVEKGFDLSKLEPF